jgi:hypothetical protein
VPVSGVQSHGTSREAARANALRSHTPLAHLSRTGRGGRLL